MIKCAPDIYAGMNMTVCFAAAGLCDAMTRADYLYNILFFWLEKCPHM